MYNQLTMNRKEKEKEEERITKETFIYDVEKIEREIKTLEQHLCIIY